MGALRSLLARAGRLVGIASFTVVEVVALAGWLVLVTAKPLGPASEIVGVSVLFGGLLLEGLLTHVTVAGVRQSPRSVAIAGFTASETLLWVGWLALVQRIGGAVGIGVAGLALAILLIPQHTVEDNVLRDEGAFDRLFDSGAISFSVIEAAGATAWLLLVFGVVPAAPVLDAAGVAGVEFVALWARVELAAPELVGLAVLAVSLFVEHLVAIRHALGARAVDTGTPARGVEPISFHQD